MELWIPESAKDTQPARFICRICNDRFVVWRAFEQHVIKCSKVHENELHEFAAYHQKIAQDIPDPEWEAYNLGLRNQGIDPDVQFNRGRKSNIRRASES